MIDHWGAFGVEIAGQDGQASFATDKVLTLFRVGVPKAILPVAEAKLGEYTVKRAMKMPLIEFELGTPEASFV